MNAMLKLFILLEALIIFDISSCKPSFYGITRDTRVDLPGSERINKRSVEDESDENGSSIEIEDDQQPDSIPTAILSNPNFTEEDRVRRSPQDSEEMDKMNLAENGLVFRPLFRPRNRNDLGRSRRSTDFYNDMEAAANGMVFIPLFRSKNQDGLKQRLRRSVEDEDYLNDMLVADNGLVFRPLFRSKSRNDLEKRFRRSLSDDDLDDFQPAENGMVFLPLFRSKNQDSVKQRLRRSLDESNLKFSVIGGLDDLGNSKDLSPKPMYKRKIRSVTEGEIKEKNDMAVAEGGLVFRPLFRSRDA